MKDRISCKIFPNLSTYMLVRSILDYIPYITYYILNINFDSGVVIVLLRREAVAALLQHLSIYRSAKEANG